MFSFKRSLIALVGVLVIVGALAILTPLISRGQGGNPFDRDTRRSFYLTQTQHNGGQALSACASGYHMASLWEIFDTSNLSYNTELGFTWADSGFGPPSGAFGWIRTGSSASVQADAGNGNCQAYTSNIVADFGSTARLRNVWSSLEVAQPISPWVGGFTPCSVDTRVWCMQD